MWERVLRHTVWSVTKAKTTPNMFMTKTPTPEDRLNAARIREQIGHQLKKHYQACMTEGLPPRLLELIKKLDEEIPEH
jgi:hypothetical protein